MTKHEGNKMGTRLPRRARLVALATALFSAIALSAPAVSGATPTSNRSYSLTITQNTSMIVDVSTSSSSLNAAVSWGDVSWGDVSWSDAY